MLLETQEIIFIKILLLHLWHLLLSGLFNIVFCPLSRWNYWSDVSVYETARFTISWKVMAIESCAIGPRLRNNQFVNGNWFFDRVQMFFLVYRQVINWFLQTGQLCLVSVPPAIFCLSLRLIDRARTPRIFQQITVGLILQLWGESRLVILHLAGGYDPGITRVLVLELQVILELGGVEVINQLGRCLLGSKVNNEKSLRLKGGKRELTQLQIIWGDLQLGFAFQLCQEKN